MVDVTDAPSTTGEANAELNSGGGIGQIVEGPSDAAPQNLVPENASPAETGLEEDSTSPLDQSNHQTKDLNGEEQHATADTPLDRDEDGLRPADDQDGGHDDTRSDADSDDGLFVDQTVLDENIIKREDISDAGSPEREKSPRHDQREHHPQLEEDDDECMIIDSKDVPANVMTKFAESEFGKHGNGAAANDDIIYTGSVKVKIEEESSTDDNDDSYSVFQGNEDSDLSDGEQPRKRRRKSSKRQPKQKQKRVRTRPEDTITDGEQGHREWQEPTEDELIQLHTKYEELSARKARGPLPLKQKVALAKITARIRAVEKMAAQESSDQNNPAEPQDNGQDEDGAAEEAVRQVLARYNLSPIPGQETSVEQDAPPEQATNAKKPRRAQPKSAKEYWERQYSENGSTQNTIPNRSAKRKRPAQGRRKNTKRDAARENRLVRMLQDSNPIAARAAQGHMTMPGPIQAKRQDDQLRAMKAFLFKISSNPNSRSTSLDMRLLKEAVKSFGCRQVKAVDGQWKLKGMISPLYNHQLVGVRWMLGQEFSPDGPWGGILGDQMGLGKTVQVLAAMSANRPSPEEIEAGRHQTLIVAPAVAISQWAKEIEKHCDKSFIQKVHHYKAKQKLHPWMWKGAEVILASYNEVAKAYPSGKTLKRIAGMKLNEQEWAEEFESELGELFGNDFYRVVLDEGHAIRNHDKKTAMACIHLSSKYRWILTGTPLHNSVDEDHDEFCKQFGNIEKDDVQGRLEAIVSSIMLRRRVDDHFLGVPILQIPRTHEPKIVWVDLTQEERLIYRRLESRFRDNMSTHLKAGTATKKRLQTFLAYLTRLRQAVAHPYLLEGVLQENFTLEDFNYLKRHLSKLGHTPMHQQVQRWVDMEYEAQDGDEPRTFGKSRFGIEFNMDSQLAVLEAGKSLVDVTCRICYEVPINPRITECGHTFCQACIADALLLSDNTCPSCKNLLHHIEALKEPERTPAEHVDEAMEEELEGPGRRKKKKKQAREIGDDENWVQPKLKDSSKWITQYDKSYPEHILVASAKTIAVKNQILIWQKEAPDDKIIVFINWSKLAGIIGRMLFEEGLGFLYYVGDMTTDQKNAAIAAFQDNPDIKILIASIRCGGQSLNLTIANRVLSVDQWWNTALENQAFGRVHRIGQRKETHFVKVVVKDSVDERLLQLQHDKAHVIARALQEDERHKTAPTLDELMRLFGADADADADAGVGGDGEDRDGVVDEGDDGDDENGEAVESGSVEEV